MNWELKQSTPDPEYEEFLLKPHPCEGCPTVIQDGNVYCERCTVIFELSEGGQMGPPSGIEVENALAKRAFAKLKMELEEAEKRIRQLEARKPRWIRADPTKDADVPLGWWIAHSIRVTGALDKSLRNKVFNLWLPSESRFENHGLK